MGKPCRGISDGQRGHRAADHQDQKGKITDGTSRRHTFGRCGRGFPVFALCVVCSEKTAGVNASCGYQGIGFRLRTPRNAPQSVVALSEGVK